MSHSFPAHFRHLVQMKDVPCEGSRVSGSQFASPTVWAQCYPGEWGPFVCKLGFAENPAIGPGERVNQGREEDRADGKADTDTEAGFPCVREAGRGLRGWTHRGESHYRQRTEQLRADTMPAGWVRSSLGQSGGRSRQFEHLPLCS